MNWKNYFSFEGRVNRIKYFFITLICELLCLPVKIIPEFTQNEMLQLQYGIVLILAIIVSICVTVQRLHDIDRPGIHFFLLLIPFYNIYLGLVLLFKKGTNGPNLYGDDPLTSSCE